MRTQKVIDAEIKALEKLRPIGPFQCETASKIQLAIEELRFGVDDTADEWNELSDDERDAVMQARDWKNGDTDEKYSTGWGNLVAH